MPERPPRARAAADVTPVAGEAEAPARRSVREHTAEADAARRDGAAEPWRAADFSTVPTRSSASPPPRLLDRLVRTLPATGGAPLPERVGRALESATGMRPPATARVHAGPASTHAAGALDARAFTTPDGAIHLGHGAGSEGDRLLLHEAAHTLQQPPGPVPSRHVSDPDDRLEANARDVVAAATAGRQARVLAGAAGVVHRDVVSDVKDKLSYRLLDWAITDEDASEAFALLDAVADADLPGVLTKLGSTSVSRLLDNLPSELKTGPRYTRILQALGAEATLPFVLGQLQTGLFDWAVTDAEVNQVFNVYANLTPAQQDQFWTLLSSRGRLARLMSNISESHEMLFVRPWVKTLIKGATAEEPNPNAVNLNEAQKTVLRTMVEETDSLATADLLLEARFNLTIDRVSETASTKKRKLTGASFSLAQLRRLWVLLDPLPEKHVLANPDLDRLTRYEGKPGSGFYDSGLDEAAIGVSGTETRFSDVVRHEVGHGVDEKIGFSSSGEHEKPERGGWIDHEDDVDAAANEATTLSAGGISALAAGDRSAVEAEMVKVMNDDTKGLPELKEAISGLPIWAILPEDSRNATRTAAIRDRALTAVVANCYENKPWRREDGGVRLGSGDKARVVQESYDGRWTSYAFVARSRRVSNYQFRAPGEWFAEAYASYYAHGDTEKGDLAKEDPNTYAWFETYVAKQ